MASALAHRFEGHGVTKALHEKQRWGRSVLLPLILFLAHSCTGCASVPSELFRQQVGPPVPFQQLLQEGEAHEGTRVILGGYILETANDPHASLLTILQAPLDSQNKPKVRDLSEGRFLVRTKTFLDPEIYSKDRKVTVGGKVSQALSKPLGNRMYRYPVIEAEELHLWPKETRHPRPYYPSYYWHYPWHLYPYGPYPWRPW